jgi:hypothetical protein
MMFRRRRIFVRLREGLTYEEIANEERVTITRIRQIVSKELKQRQVDSGAEHAKLQLERLVPAIQLAAEAIAAGDVSAITPYLKALDRLDRYQTVASAEQVYDDEARKKLMEKINRMAENFGIDEVRWNAVGEHLEKIQGMPPEGWGETDGEALAKAPDVMAEAGGPAASPAEARADSGFFYLNRP